jgi:hypothetical protein
MIFAVLFPYVKLHQFVLQRQVGGDGHDVRTDEQRER